MGNKRVKETIKRVFKGLFRHLRGSKRGVIEFKTPKHWGYIPEHERLLKPTDPEKKTGNK